MTKIPQFQRIAGEPTEPRSIVDDRFDFLVTELLESSTVARHRQGLQKFKFESISSTLRIWLTNSKPFLVTVGDESPSDTSERWNGKEFARVACGVLYVRERSPLTDGLGSVGLSPYRRSTTEDNRVLEACINDILTDPQIEARPDLALNDLYANGLAKRPGIIGSFLARTLI